MKTMFARLTTAALLIGLGHLPVLAANVLSGQDLFRFIVGNTRVGSLDDRHRVLRVLRPERTNTRARCGILHRLLGHQREPALLRLRRLGVRQLRTAGGSGRHHSGFRPRRHIHRFHSAEAWQRLRRLARKVLSEETHGALPGKRRTFLIISRGLGLVEKPMGRFIAV